MYVPHAQDWWGLMIVTVRAHGSPAMLADTLRREVARLDPDIKAHAPFKGRRPRAAAVRLSAMADT